MRVGIFHNRYRSRGGEDVVVEMETELLAKAGHTVSLLCVGNDEEIDGPLAALRAGLRARWNPATVGRVDAFLAKHPIDVAHVHNTFPVLSPSLHATLAARGVPVVQTLHNYRLLCANATLLRDGAPCEDCVSRGPWNAVRHGCYRGSRLQTAVWAELTAHHRARGTWRQHVDRFIAPSAFARRKLLAADIEPERISVVPNPIADPGAPSERTGAGAIFVGRLSPEKGVDCLLDAWSHIEGIPLTIVGDGPDAARLRARAAGREGIAFTGALPRDAVLRRMREAAFVVVPSLWYEVFPTTVVEAMACGRAVVGPEQTAVGETIAEAGGGACFRLGDARSLAEICWTFVADEARTRELGAQARAYYEETLAPERSIARLLEVFESVTRPPPRAGSPGASRSP
jgi:glycosyltransferase involved in cell wall biosynthesis